MGDEATAVCGAAPLSGDQLKRFKDMVERLRGEELEDYEIYGCLAKYVSDNLRQAPEQPGGNYATVISYLDRHGITAEEVLGYVNNDAGQLLADDALAQRFAALMDYMENKGVAAEEVFECLEQFVDSGGTSIYNAFGNLNEIDYFNYATVSGYLSSRGIAAESVRDFLQHCLDHEPALVASLRPSDDPSFNVQGGDAMAAVGGIYDDVGGGGNGGTANGNGSKADIFSLADHAADSALMQADSLTDGGAALASTSGLSDEEDDITLDAINLHSTGGGGNAANGAHGSGASEQRLRLQVESLRREKAALEAKLRSVPSVSPTEVADLRRQNGDLRRQLADSKEEAAVLQRGVDKLQGSVDRSDAYLQRLAAEMEGTLAAAASGSSAELSSLSRSLQQLLDQRRALEAAETYKYTRDEVEGLRNKLRMLHEKLQVNPSSKLLPRPKERNLHSFNDFIESLEEAQDEVDRLREENFSTMKQLVMKKVELAETQEEVTKTKRALIRAVNKQMQLAYKLDEIKTEYAEVMQRHGNRLTRGFSRKHSDGT